MQKFGAQPLTKQEIVANTCPLNCGKDSTIMRNSMVMSARPPGGNVATWWSRCQVCLCYWETSPAGKIMVLRAVLTSELCPDCRQPIHLVLGHICALGKKED